MISPKPTLVRYCMYCNEQFLTTNPKRMYCTIAHGKLFWVKHRRMQEAEERQATQATALKSQMDRENIMRAKDIPSISPESLLNPSQAAHAAGPGVEEKHIEEKPINPPNDDVFEWPA